MVENPAKGCAWGLVIAAFFWVAILATAAVVWVKVIAPWLKAIGWVL
jgi:hypothetical protein